MAHSDLAPANIEGAANQADRRSCRRFPAAELKAELKIKSGFFSTALEEIHTVDYNKKGLAFVSSKPFEENQSITLKITLVMEMGNISIDNIIAVVKNKFPEHEHQQHGDTRIGAAFDFESTRHMKSIDTQSPLGRIEGILERSQNLRMKMFAQE